MDRLQACTHPPHIWWSSLLSFTNLFEKIHVQISFRITKLRIHKDVVNKLTASHTFSRNALIIVFTFMIKVTKPCIEGEGGQRYKT